MKTEVLLERVNNERYRATGSGRFAVSVEGASREEALNNFQKAAAGLLPPHAEVITLEIPVSETRSVGGVPIPPDDPWGWFAGIAKEEEGMGSL